MQIYSLLCLVGVQGHKGNCALKLHIKSVGKSIIWPEYSFYYLQLFPYEGKHFHLLRILA